MKKAKDPKIFLKHILESVEIIEINVKDKTKKEFLRKIILQDAVIRRLEIIGEAVKNISLIFRAEHTTVPWKEVAGLRDFLIHEYFGVDLNLVWKIVQKDLPPLKKEILKFLQKTK